MAASNIQRLLKEKEGSLTNVIGRVVLLQDQFCSAVYPWQQLREESDGKIRLDIVPYPDIDDTDGWTPAILRRLESDSDNDNSDNSDVIAVCLPPLHWSDGSFIDLEIIGQVCRQKKIPLIVDATQGVGIMPLSVAKIQPTFLACSVHKVRPQKGNASPWENFAFQFSAYEAFGILISTMFVFLRVF